MSGFSLASPPALFAAAALGIASGIGGYAVVYAQGAAYLGDDPAACANCHPMSGHYDAWLTGSHHAVATCNDCHTPASPVAKYLVKAENGLHHSLAFTFGGYPDHIIARPESREVVEGQCRHCHAALVASMPGRGEVSCLHCHASAGHLR